MAADIQGHRVADWESLKDKGDFVVIDPGHPDFHTSVTIIGFICPNCGKKKYVPLKPSDPEGWEWNGDRDHPTITPSIFFFNMHYPEAKCRWHGFITAGNFKTV